MNKIIMWLVFLFRMISHAFLVSFSPLAVIEYPICGRCNNVILDELGFRCKLYGELDIVNGKITNKACTVVRKNETMCGVEGKFYTRYIPFNSI
jgi:hypothetical protein